MALKHLALGGVYLGGGVAPKNLDLLRERGFVAAFLDKGRMRPVMEQIPVWVIPGKRALSSRIRLCPITRPCRLAISP
jgi:glucokinase